MSITWLNLPPTLQIDPLFFTYGEYGGAHYSGGDLIQPGETPDFTVKPIDALDTLFREHDRIYYNPDSTSLDRAQADLALIQGIRALPDDAVSGRGDVYAGLTVLAMLYQIGVANEHPEFLLQLDIEDVVNGATDLIAEGAAELTPQDLAALEMLAVSLSSVMHPELVTAGEKIADLVGAVRNGDGSYAGCGMLTDGAFRFATEFVQEHLEQVQDMSAETGLSGLIEKILDGDLASHPTVEAILEDLPGDPHSFTAKFAGIGHWDLFA